MDEEEKIIRYRTAIRRMWERDRHDLLEMLGRLTATCISESAADGHAQFGAPAHGLEHALKAAIYQTDRLDKLTRQNGAYARSLYKEIVGKKKP